jgi:uncharacterized protein YbjT (DUF2867 family)
VFAPPGTTTLPGPCGVCLCSAFMAAGNTGCSQSISTILVAAIDHITQPVNEIIDATGPETYSYREMVEMIAREIGSRALIVSMPAMFAYQAVRVLGWMVGDVINTSDDG